MADANVLPMRDGSITISALIDHYMAQFSPTLGEQEGPPAGA